MEECIYSLRGPLVCIIYKPVEYYGKSHAKLINTHHFYLKNNSTVEKMLHVLLEYQSVHEANSYCFLLVPEQTSIPKKTLHKVLTFKNVDMCLLYQNSYIIFQTATDIEIKFKKDNYCLLLTQQGLYKLLSDVPNYLTLEYYFVPILLVILFIYVVMTNQKRSRDLNVKKNSSVISER